MAKKSPLNPEPPRRRRGRPTREEELRRALVELGVDPALVDPLRVLASVAGDAGAPPSARVAAARALLAARDPARNERPSNGKAGKKALAARAAATAGGRGSGWGDDLAWTGGRRQQ